jgi:nucleotide-binding universal stress UspA family protein
MTAVAMISEEMDAKPAALRKTKSIVVATDGSDTSLAAFNAAELIRSRTGCDVRIVSALEPLPEVIPPVEGIILPLDWEEVREKGQREVVTRQLDTIKSMRDVPVDIVFGKPCEAIAKYARKHDAGLIIVGYNKHSVIGRILGEETAVDIARLSEVPLLVATEDMKRVPRRIIIGMSLDPDGMQSTAEALALIADSPSVSCVHVQPRDEFLGVDWAQYDSEYQFALNERFASVEISLNAYGMRPDLIFLHGNPAKEIVDFADYSKAELIVIDIRRKVGKARAVGGRTARRIMRHAECSVPIVPNVKPA